MQIETSLTKTELLEFALVGLQVKLSRINDQIRMVHARLNNTVYVIRDTGQPCCPTHGADYDEEGNCAICADLTGTTPRKSVITSGNDTNGGAFDTPKAKKKPKRGLTKSGRLAISRAQKLRWARIRAAGAKQKR